MNCEKYYNEKGQVAVLRTNNFGSGWSTWNTKYAQELMFDRKIVELLVEGKTDEIVKYVEETYSDEVYTGGVEHLIVEYVDRGCLVKITEYDGLEKLHVNFTDYYLA